MKFNFIKTYDLFGVNLSPFIQKSRIAQLYYFNFWVTDKV